MSTSDAIIVFTFKSVERLLREGGTSSWRLDRKHARQCSFAVCTRNTKRDEADDNLEDPSHVDDAPKSEDHQAAFLVGKVCGVVPCPRHGDKGRYLVRFSEYALVNVPNAWKGDRNPVKYGSLAELGIDPTRLKWNPMPAQPYPNAKPEPEEPRRADGARPLSMAEAKRGLAITFGVAPEAVEITIRG